MPQLPWRLVQVTEQAVTAFKIPDTRLASLNRGLRRVHTDNAVHEHCPTCAWGGALYTNTCFGLDWCLPHDHTLGMSSKFCTCLPKFLMPVWQRCRGMQLGNFSFVEEALGLGAAGGNQFDIVLRGVTGATPQQVSVWQGCYPCETQ
jgi:hypothetical protein